MISKEKLAEVARNQNEKESEGRGVPWPDCYDVSRSIQKELVEEYDLRSDLVDISEYRNGNFRHYYVLIQPEAFGKSCIVDASFRQFANDTDSDFNLGNPEEIQDVVIVEPKSRYIFWE